MNLNSTLAILTALAPVLIPLSLVLYHILLTQLPANKAALVEKRVSQVVSAVEQTYKSVPGSGAYKKAEAIRLLGVMGVKVDPTQLDVLLEACVASLASQQ